MARNAAGEWDGYVVDLAKALGQDIGFDLVYFPVVGSLVAPQLLSATIFLPALFCLG